METQENKFTQLCVWPGTIVLEDEVKAFEEYFHKVMGSRVKWAESVTTLPTIANGEPVPNTGGRIDAFFFIHNEDVGKFAVKRLIMGIHWWEDVVKYNDAKGIYPKELLEKYPCTW